MMMSNLKSFLLIYKYASIKEIRIERGREKEREQIPWQQERDSQFQCKRKMSYFLIGTK